MSTAFMLKPDIDTPAKASPSKIERAASRYTATPPA
jgi:hypothetical protein